MAEITASAVNEFRKATGLGLMECKALLKEADGDVKKAMTLAKERGLKNAEKRVGRAASAGRVEFVAGPGSKSGALVELNCETDFVARNDEFRRVARELAEQVLEAGDNEILAQKARNDSSKTVQEVLTELNARTGENVTLSRAARFAGEGRVDAYIHHNAKSGAMVEVIGGDEGLARELAMQVVASRPLCVRREEMPTDVVAEQKRIFLTQAADKPEGVRDKIATGKLEAWFAENTLVDQPLVRDPSKRVRDLLGGSAQVTRFAHFVVGEGAEAEATAGA
ncbi:MAG TPA: translation elongation factor Ts [Isosphaeraceae bacterium]|jgi:elongation factor Ts|nr:translation elongation factor Ts [Isosphaeraceae bacterium]